MDACFEVPKLYDSILNFQILFNIRNIELKMSKHIRRICLRSVALLSGRYCTDLDAYISKKQKVPVNAEYYRKEIMSSRCLLFIYLGLDTDYISAFNC